MEDGRGTKGVRTKVGNVLGSFLVLVMNHGRGTKETRGMGTDMKKEELLFFTTWILFSGIKYDRLFTHTTFV